MVKKLLEDGETIGAVSYMSASAVRDLFNIFALVSANGKEGMVAAHCDIKDSMTVGQQLMDVIDSIMVNYQQ